MICMILAQLFLKFIHFEINPIIIFSSKSAFTVRYFAQHKLLILVDRNQYKIKTKNI
jgi:hypothetical protein